MKPRGAPPTAAKTRSMSKYRVEKRDSQPKKSISASAQGVSVNPSQSEPECLPNIQFQVASSSTQAESHNVVFPDTEEEKAFKELGKRFNKIPKELQLAIWRALANVPRIILISPGTKLGLQPSGKGPLRFYSRENNQWSCVSPTLPTLSISSETRTETLRCLTLMFTNTYVDLERDTVVLEWRIVHKLPEGLHDKLMSNLRKIKHIGLLESMGAFSLGGKSKIVVRRLLLSFLPALETITFILPPNSADWLGDYAFLDWTNSKEWPRDGRQDQQSRLTFEKHVWRPIEEKTDVWGRLSQKLLTKAIAADYELAWATEIKHQELKTALQAQLDRRGGKAPVVKVFRYDISPPIKMSK